MFIKIMLSYVLGYLKLSVEGYYIERFINICNNKKIIICNSYPNIRKYSTDCKSGVNSNH